MTDEPHDGRSGIERDGFSYLPRFISLTESEQLIADFTSANPIWESRHRSDAHARDGASSRRITRPVYWLGGWQFACLGYYAEPHYSEGRCLRAEPFSLVIDKILERLRPLLETHDPHVAEAGPPNTCLINYYGSEIGKGPPVDQARLRMHRDGEPGPVVMFSIGQPGLLEFLEPDSTAPELAVWTRHRSVVVFSGPVFKDRLYHRLVRVRHGEEPQLSSPVPDFRLRRISTSFRYVPEELISEFHELPLKSRAHVRGYVEQLATGSAHFAQQLKTQKPSRPE